jgi:lipopolysaccharide export system protein LptA
VKQGKAWRGWVGVFSLVLILGLAGPGVARGAQGKKGQQQEFPLHITAARLEADQNERVVIFSGQVKATYGDSILYADQLRVYYEQPPAGTKTPAPAAQEKKDTSPLGDLGGGKINRIVARGGVRLVQEDKVATGQEATYFRAKDEIVLVGNPQLWRAENTLKGERIIFNLRTNKVLVESSPKKRVEANLYPSGQSSPGAAKTNPLRPKGPKPR